MLTPTLDWTALREYFHERLRVRMAEIRTIVDQIEAGDDEQAVLDALSLQFHSLAGIGGTYGYQAITELARRGEDICRIKPLALDAIDEITRCIEQVGEEKDQPVCA